jgi:hypothetical protein
MHTTVTLRNPEYNKKAWAIPIYCISQPVSAKYSTCMIVVFSSMAPSLKIFPFRLNKFQSKTYQKRSGWIRMLAFVFVYMCGYIFLPFFALETVPQN